MKIKLKFVLVLLLFFHLGYSQLSNFTLNVTATNETCPNDGALNFNVTNTVAGSTIVYSIYLFPNLTTPISVLSANSLSGLGAGTYRVVATQSLGNQSGTQFQDALIEDDVVDLTYQVTSQKEICGSDGVITVTELTGDAIQFELFSGPEIRPLQTSNVFTGLPDGTYLVRAFDACGEGVVQTHTVQNASPALDFELIAPAAVGCTNVSIGFSFTLVSPTGAVKYPLQIQTTVYPPTGGTVVTNSTLNSGNQFATIVQLYSQQPYNYSFTIVDGCGISYTLNGTINNLSTNVFYTLLNVSCTTKIIKFSNVSALQLISAPAGYPNALPENLTSQIISGGYISQPLPVGTYVFNATGLCGGQATYTVEIQSQDFPPYSFVYGLTCNQGSLAFYNVTQIVLVSAPPTYIGILPYDFTATINNANIAVLEDLPAGTYVFNVVDVCLNPTTITATINPVNLSPTFEVLKSCINDKGSLKITGAGQMNSVQLIAAPSNYVGTLPQNFTSLIISNNQFTLNNLPSGNYVFTVTNACDAPSTITIAIPDYQETIHIEETPNCGSFDVQVEYSDNSTSLNTFWLQKFYPLSNSWGHPGTGVLYANGDNPTPLNSYLLPNNATTYNLIFTGQFRVMKKHQQFETGISLPQNCLQVLYEFEYDGQPDIIDIYSISCNTTFEVVVNAVGLGPLLYRITTKNGLPFLVQNGTSNLFTGLAAAVYNFQVEDVCGNILNNSFEVNIPNPLEITPSTICQGQPVSLSVPNFDFLQYQWWKGNNTTTILSTTNSLVFNPFNASTDAGTYYVSTVYNGNSNSCLNSVLSFTISSEGFNPQAGNDASLSYCGNQEIIDLFSLLQGNFTTDGEWQEVTSSGMLSGFYWDSSMVLPGVYQFKYRVDGNCYLFDEALINIEIKAVPNAPVASVNPILCDGQELNLYASTIPNASYSWSGPNNFSSTQQNPQINPISAAVNGIYIVKAIVNGCESGTSSTEVIVNPLPEFELEKACVGSRFLLTAIVVNDSFDATLATYNWTGPNGFIETGNPIDITGNEAGDYALEVTNNVGCLDSKTINVLGTYCEIPNVITPNNDGFNDTFDLSGFDVAKLEIYNRYGRKVYEKENYLKDWYGQNNNDGLLPESTYYFLITLNDGTTKTGWVLVSGVK